MRSRRSCGSALIIAFLVGCGDSTSPPEQDHSFTTPITGAPMIDVFYGAYMDHATGSAIHDYMCGRKSFDGHRGVDILLRNFREQDAGVPVIAAADGEVEWVVEGHADRNTTWAHGGGFGNHVVLRHAGGLVTIYAHLRRGSVRVFRGQRVGRGEMLGMVGSSGTSNWPHLHFEVLRNGAPVDPFGGECAPSQSLWSAQLPYQDEFMVTDAGLLDEGPSFATLLERPPTVGSFPLDADYLWFWLQLANSKAAVVRFEFRNPSGSTAVEVSGSVGPTFSMEVPGSQPAGWRHSTRREMALRGTASHVRRRRRCRLSERAPAGWRPTPRPSPRPRGSVRSLRTARSSTRRRGPRAPRGRRAS